MRQPRTVKSAKARAWSAISKYIRQKFAVDEMVKCVTCDRVSHWKDMHCGHYQHGLTYAMVSGEFCVLEENLHPQCPGCNTYRGGMLDRYTLYMEDHYGRKMVDELMALRHKPLKMRIDDYWGLEQKYIELAEEVAA